MCARARACACVKMCVHTRSLVYDVSLSVVASSLSLCQSVSASLPSVCLSLCLYVHLSLCPSLICPPSHLSLHPYVSVSLSVSQTKEPVLNALGACKMLKEMSKMEYGKETKRSMKELSLKFESLAHGEA